MMQRIKKSRYSLPDIFRGVAVIAMVVYHTLWDLVFLFRMDIPFMRTDWEFVFQQSICITFVFVSGFCSQFGKKRLKRALIVLGCSAVLTLVTAVVMPENIIIHGVLSLIGASMLIAFLLEKLLVKINPYLGILMSLALFLLTYNVSNGFIGLGDYVIYELPQELYINDVTAFFGFPQKGFFSTDYVPFLPWIFMFLLGYFFYSILQRKNKLQILSSFSCKPLEFIGRHSLEIYMIHQPVIYGVLLLVFGFDT